MVLRRGPVATQLTYFFASRMLIAGSSRVASFEENFGFGMGSSPTRINIKCVELNRHVGLKRLPFLHPSDRRTVEFVSPVNRVAGGRR